MSTLRQCLVQPGPLFTVVFSRRRAADIVQKFESLDTEGVGHFRAETARAWLESVQPDNEQALSDKQIDFLVKVAVGDEEEDAIDLVKFADLVTRLDLCLKQQQAQKTT